MMTVRRIAVRTICAVLAQVALAGALIVVAPGASLASTCASRSGAQPPNPGSAEDQLTSVAALSPCNVWAVGYYSNATSRPMAHTLVEHWNGRSWRHVFSPDPGGAADDNRLMGVAATSRNDAWAVGSGQTSTTNLTLIEHWNGTAWKQVPSPNPRSTDSELLAVSATSASNAWAVGDYFTRTSFKTLIEHWNGTAWKRVASPSPGAGGNAVLRSVSATSARNAWAVGSFLTGAEYKTLVEHWNGTTWKRVRSPNPSSAINDLSSISVTAASNAWAVGEYSNGKFDKTLIEHWNGTAWRRVTSPNLSPRDNLLAGVTATSSSDAWAVGSYFNGSVTVTLALHCC